LRPVVDNNDLAGHASRAKSRHGLIDAKADGTLLIEAWQHNAYERLATNTCRLTCDDNVAAKGNFGEAPAHVSVHVPFPHARAG
jgi:hypothetical protein